MIWSRRTQSPRPNAVRLLYVGLLALAIPLLAWNGFVQQLNATCNDILLRLRGRVHSAALDKIVILAIDDSTLSRYGPLPLQRSVLAAGLEHLAQFGPQVLAIDLLLSEPGDPAQDQALARALELFPHAVLSAALAGDPGSPVQWILPLPAFAAAHGTAHAHAAPDADGVVRSVLLAKTAENRRFRALGLEAAKQALDQPPPLETRDSLELGSIRIPAGERSQRLMSINYAGPDGTFRRFSFCSLLDNTARAADFRGKLVFLGVTAQGAGDRLFTPVSSEIGMSGVEIHANVARTILDRAFLVPLSAAGEFAVLLLIAATCVLGIANLGGIRLPGALAGIGAAVVAASALAFRLGHVWPLASFLAIWLVSGAVCAGGEYAAMAWGLRTSEQKRREYALRVQAVAHEIKTPLTAIQGSSEMIAGQLIPDQERVQMAGLIHKESRRLTELIRAFLDVERMASGSLRIEKRPTGLEALCADVLDRARLYAARKKIQIVSRVPDISVPADPELLSFAIYNLLTNAVKYSPKQTRIALDVSAQGDHVAIAVSDEGYGIAPEEQKKIFERFYRGKPGNDHRQEGSGIGLALVKEIVGQHGGRIEVESKPGAGSRFTIVLPR